jgi:CHAT domain-containing protein
MQRHELIAKLLVINKKRSHLSLLKQYSDLIDLQFARDLKNTCYESWTKAPQKTLNAATALEALYQICPNDEVRAMVNWARGIASLIEGKIEKAIVELDISSDLFKSLKQPGQSAHSQASKLYALSLLGRYDEAVETGKAALKIFEKDRDFLASAKVEVNLGNIALRREFYADAEKFFLSARERFIQLNNKTWLAMCENDLAITYSSINNYRKAEKFYDQALTNAREMKMSVTEAEIEASMGNLALFRGRFDDALRFLELSRQKYDELKMPHQTAIAELEIADIYLELNLSDEAYLIYEKITESLKRLKLQGEEARARANFGRAAFLRNNPKKANQELEKSARLYLLEKNTVGAATVRLTEAAFENSQKNHKNALKIILEAKKLLAKTENPRQKLFSKWLHGETLYNLQQFKKAKQLLTETFTEAAHTEQSNLAQMCLNSLGNLALQTNDNQTAEGYFKKAVRMIEMLRAPLAAEEFKMTFLANKLAPFESLAKIYLAENDLKRAFLMVEKSKARTLAENLNGYFVEQSEKNSTKLDVRLANLREELNWFYSRMNRAEAGEYESLHKETKRLEKQIVDVTRQIYSTRTDVAKNSTKRRSLSKQDDIKLLQNKLGNQKVLIDFVSFDGIISAFVIGDKNIHFVADLASENEIISLLERLQFQFGTLRFGKQNLSAFMPNLKKRSDSYLQKIYEKLIDPIKRFIGECDLVVIPAGVLHYVPFHALHDGRKYLIETREIVHSPSAAVWRSLSEKPVNKIESALLIGFADEKIPFVNNEIGALRKIFPRAKTFTDKGATFEHYTENAPKFDILHLACHGQYRPDNPMFSSLHLADGFITVRDICSQNLRAELVTLSACETGLNKVFAGEEIIGLARGFLSAGVRSILLSLWMVNDESTKRLMVNFYTHLQRGYSVPASLQQAQLEFIKDGEHPYYWSPFVLIG